MNKEKAKNIDYEKEYLRLTMENSKLKKENEEYKQSLLDMARVNSVVIQLSGVIKEIETQLRIISKR